MRYDIRTIDELVEHFGGDTALARKLGLTQQAVGQWKARGEIPPGWHLRLVVDLARNGVSAHPALFGLTEGEWPPFLYHRKSNDCGTASASV